MQLEPIEETAVRVAKRSWESLPDDQLAAAYLAASWPGRGHELPPENIARKAAEDLLLVDSTGRMHELVWLGLDRAVCRLWSEATA